MPSQRSDDGRPVGARSSAESGARGPLIHVTTRCTSLDDFVEKFASWASPGVLVLPASGELPVGTEARFVIRLKDQTIAMRGRCRVSEARTIPATVSQARRIFLRVALLELDEENAAIHRSLIAQRSGGGVPVAVPAVPSDPTLVNPPRVGVPAPPLTRSPPPPPLAALASTIAARPLPRRATSPLGVPRLPPSAVTAQLPPEARVPGAAFTLPANPLSEMNAADLASFIESTLLETDDEDATVERPAEPPVVREAAVVEPTEPTVVDSQPQPLLARAPLADESRPPPRRFPRRKVAPYIICALASVLIGHAIWRPKTPRPAAPPIVSPPPAPPPPVVAAPAPALPRAEQAAPTPAPEPARAPGVCLARITTEPAGARVAWLGQEIGRSPISGVPIPCGAGDLTISHERYEAITRSVVAVAGEPLAADERLHRPPATLDVSSSPAGATISLNGHHMGTAPRSIQTWRYEHVAVRAQLPGYAPWTKKIYLRAATTQLSAQLVPRRR